MHNLAPVTTTISPDLKLLYQGRQREYLLSVVCHQQHEALAPLRVVALRRHAGVCDSGLIQRHYTVAVWRALRIQRLSCNRIGQSFAHEERF